MSRGIKNNVRVGKLTLASDEAGIVQKMQIYLNQYESLDAVHSMQLYGFASASPVGTDAVYLTLSGDGSNGCVIATSHTELRPINMVSGETQIYDSKGQRIYITQANGKLSIVITAGNEVDITADTKVTVTAPDTVVNGRATINGNLQVNGTITATGDIKGGTISLETHRHSASGGSGTGGPPVA